MPPSWPSAWPPNSAPDAARMAAARRLLLPAALAASALLNVWLYRRARQYLREANAVRLDPLGLRAAGLSLTPGNRAAVPLSETYGVSPPSRPRVVFYGDSRAAQWPAPALDSFEFINAGVNGQSTAQALERCRHHLGPLRPDIVVLQAGINDLRLIPMFPDQQAALTAGCLANLRALAGLALADCAVVVLTTLFPLGPAPVGWPFYWSPAVAESVREVNAALRSWAAPGLVVFDAYALLAAPDGQALPAYAEDTLHLTPEGYAALNVGLAEVLLALRTD
jgi:lysophospholipase L1-like esterase